MNLLDLFIGFLLLPFIQLQSVDLLFSVDPKQLDVLSNLELEFRLSNDVRRIRLNLQPSRNIVSPIAELRYLGSEGISDGSSSALESSTLFFKGEALLSEDGQRRWRKAGWARIMIRPQVQPRLFEGAFSLDGDHHHISLDSNYRATQLAGDPSPPESLSPHMVVWSQSNVAENGHDSAIFQRIALNESLCAIEGYASRLDGSRPRQNSARDDDTMISHSRRQGDMDPFNPIDTIGSTDGCPTTRLVALLGVAADCTYTSQFDSLEDARANIISQINIASQIYEDTFNISLAIRNLTISDASCPSDAAKSIPWNIPCSANVDVSGRLTLFSEWRGRFNDGNAAWTLLSACSSTSTVGMAWIGSACRQGSSTIRQGGAGRSVASANVVVRTGSEWQVMAHELAHNFGASHDCTSNECGLSGSTQDCCPLSESSCNAEGRYIMNPQVGEQIREFSPCTIGMICTAFGRQLIDTSCLVDEDDAPDINDSQCGNGIVEAGEACDCGGAEGCAETSCCNPDTCQLLPDAACDPWVDACCTDQCQVAERGLVCRASRVSCDPEEMCDGVSSQCPEDEQDFDSCGDDGGGDSGDEDEDSINSRGGSGNWVDRNRTAVIAVSASVGGLILTGIAICVISSMRRRKQSGRRLTKNLPTDAPDPAMMGVTGQGQGMIQSPQLVIYR
ncbi:Metallo-peptidase family M12-domain-containing protein [Ilyonectria sp. MPI-CAGE-AT-0026]|nr:Metallo-peptidase family M12-domain-containing protein [Ilyonectria sp. MPI-CAGE-AT-0026]